MHLSVNLSEQSRLESVIEVTTRVNIRYLSIATDVCHLLWILFSSIRVSVQSINRLICEGLQFINQIVIIVRQKSAAEVTLPLGSLKIIYSAKKKTSKRKVFIGVSHFIRTVHSLLLAALKKETRNETHNSLLFVCVSFIFWLIVCD